MPFPERDAELVQIVNAALADATARAVRPDGTSWLACGPGCTPCCHGVFRISMLDAARLQQGMEALAHDAPVRADAIRQRALSLVEDLRSAFPGDAATGQLHPETDSAWEIFADLPSADAACPVLDPETGRCELYDFRPLTCRVFGPPVESDGGIGMCELCYVGAKKEDVLHGEMFLDHHALEQTLDADLPPGETVIAWVVASSPARAALPEDAAPLPAR